MEPEDFRMLDLADECLVAVLRYLLAREGGTVKPPFGRRYEPSTLDERTLKGLLKEVETYRSLRESRMEQDRIKAANARGRIDAFWAPLRSHGLGALRAQADARLPDYEE